MSTLRIGLLLVLLVALAGCAAGGAGPTPIPPGGTITTPEKAVERVVAANPRFAGIRERDPELIGQSHWYEVTPASGVGAYIVTMRIGWGDCPAGCIDEHRWVYAVGPDGAVTLQTESGPDVPADVWPAGDVQPGVTGVLVQALAGPVCPVEQDPPDPACAPRPVVGAIVRILDGQGQEIAAGQLDATGSALIPIAPGAYVVVPEAVEGLIGTPGPQDVVVVDGRATPVALAYDTGIR